VLQIAPVKVPVLIGKGGATIREITTGTGSVIDISNDGRVQVSATSEVFELTLKIINHVTADPQLNTIYQGVVVNIIERGLFIRLAPLGDQQTLAAWAHIMPKWDGYLPENSGGKGLKLDDKVQVKIINIDGRGKILLAIQETDDILGPIR
jgi:polyribonucleotide nucleotidyltransferase